MADSIVYALALDPSTGLRKVDQAQWANLEALLRDTAPTDLAAAVRTFVSSGSFDKSKTAGASVCILNARS